MPDTIAAVAPRRERASEPLRVTVRDSRARLASIGGGILLALCIALTAAIFVVSALPQATGAQRVILLALTLASWAYLADSMSERLRITDDAIEYTSFLGRSRRWELDELAAVLMTYRGFTLDDGFICVEFRTRDRNADRLSLGPCWRRDRLGEFMQSVQAVLIDPTLLRE